MSARAALSSALGPCSATDSSHHGFADRPLKLCWPGQRGVVWCRGAPTSSESPLRPRQSLHLSGSPSP